MSARVSRLSHTQIWAAIDSLADRRGLTPSALARQAGLDPTTFNKSKRLTPEGRRRWPGTESLAKVLDATGLSFEEFAGIVADVGGGARSVSSAPVTGLARAGEVGFFSDAVKRRSTSPEHVAIPRLDDAKVFAIEVTDDSLEPIYREGDLLIVSPAAASKPGDRVIVKLRRGQAMPGVLATEGKSAVSLAPIRSGGLPQRFDRGRLAWIARIVWASQ